MTEMMFDINKLAKLDSRLKSRHPRWTLYGEFYLRADGTEETRGPYTYNELEEAVNLLDSEE